MGFGDTHDLRPRSWHRLLSEHPSLSMVNPEQGVIKHMDDKRASGTISTTPTYGFTTVV